LTPVNFTPKQREAARLLSDPLKTRILLRGGRRSGKTFTIAHKIRQRALEYPGCKQLIARKTLKNAAQSVWLETMLPILRQDQAAGICRIFKQPNLAEYKGGSLILLGGLAPNEIDDALGKEFATIYPNECSEISYQSIPPLISSLNDRTPHRLTKKSVKPMIIFDCNPPTVKHWSYTMFMLNLDPVTLNPLAHPEWYGTLKMNPADNRENLAAGFMESLESMSPRDRLRYLEGEYGQLSGLVYDNFDPEKHVYDELPDIKGLVWYRTIDFGFTNPFACYWAAWDIGNETLYIDDEWYHSNITINDHARIIRERDNGRQFRETIADHDAGDRAILEQAGIRTTKAIKDVASGINAFYDGLNRVKIKINRRCVNLINELYSYQWKDNSRKDEPIKENDHGLDAVRYLYMHFMTAPAKPQFYSAN